MHQYIAVRGICCTDVTASVTTECCAAAIEVVYLQLQVSGKCCKNILLSLIIVVMQNFQM